MSTQTAGPIRPGQRPPRPWRALLARRAGRWPRSVFCGFRFRWTGHARAGRGNASPVFARRCLFGPRPPAVGHRFWRSRL